MKVLKQSFISTIILFLLCGVMYPYFVTGISKVLFKEKANGSLIYVDGKAVGSKLIGQKFTEEKYFHGRPSAYDYNTYDEKPDETVLASSGGTNYANSNPDYIKGVEDNNERIVVKHFESRDALKDYLLTYVHPDDVLLLKASNGMKLKEIAEAFLQNEKKVLK